MITSYSKDELAIIKAAIEDQLEMIPFRGISISLNDSIGVLLYPDKLVVGYIPVSKNMMKLFASGFPENGLMEQLLYNSVKQILTEIFMPIATYEIAAPDLIKKIKQHSKATKKRFYESHRT
jgi:hypothetical protein